MITIEEFKNKITKKSRLIGLDLGSKRVGISICDECQSIATPFKTIQKDNFDKFLDELKLIIKENNIEGIIVGNPINMDGSLGPSAQSVKDVCSNILKKMRMAGNNSMSFGVESADEQVLKKASRRFNDWEKVKENIDYCKEIGISTRAYFIMSFDGDSIKVVFKTLIADLIKAVPPNQSFAFTSTPASNCA